MNEPNLYKNLAKYFSGESSAEEIKEINEWLNENERNKSIFNEIKSVWQSSKPREKSFDSDKALTTIFNKSRDSYYSRMVKSSSRLNKIKYNPVLLKIAASLMFLIVISLFTLTLLNHDDKIELNKTEIISADKNEIRRVRLKDGTLVTLNSESSITIHENFNIDERIIALSGEAYFEVKHDRLKPFFINAHGASIKVVGTKFNITAWKEDSDVTVAVAEGMVRFKSATAEDNDAVIVAKGEMSLIANNNSPLKPIKLDIEKYYFFWLTDKLSFYNASFKSVIHRLEMKYNVDIAVSDISILSKHLSANFNDEPFAEILNAISIALNLGYTVNQNKIVFNVLNVKKNN